MHYRLGQPSVVIGPFGIRWNLSVLRKGASGWVFDGQSSSGRGRGSNTSAKNDCDAASAVAIRNRNERKKKRVACDSVQTKWGSGLDLTVDLFPVFSWAAPGVVGTPVVYLSRTTLTGKCPASSVRSALFSFDSERRPFRASERPNGAECCGYRTPRAMSTWCQWIFADATSAFLARAYRSHARGARIPQNRAKFTVGFHKPGCD